MLTMMFHSYRLSLCEKALAQYLETKRLAFPRFYFISSTDLLDILSKGTQPTQVILILKVSYCPLLAKECQFLYHCVNATHHVTCSKSQKTCNKNS